jgi:hypothetical protein
MASHPKTPVQRAPDPSAGTTPADVPTCVCGTENLDRTSPSRAASLFSIVLLGLFFITVSIFGGNISELGGDYIMFFLFVFLFWLKMCVDDYVYFDEEANSSSSGLAFSLLLYVLLSASIAFAASEKIDLALGTLIFMFFVGFLWIVKDMSPTEPTESRLRGYWFLFNILAMIGLFLTTILTIPCKTEITTFSIFFSIFILLLAAELLFFTFARALGGGKNKGT